MTPIAARQKLQVTLKTEACSLACPDNDKIRVSHQVPGVALKEPNGAEAYVTMLWTSLAVATMGAISHWATTQVKWQLIVVSRAMLGFLFSLVLARLSSVRVVVFKPAMLWIRSMSGSIGLVCSFYALTHLPISNAITLSNTFPIWVTLLSWPISGKRPNVTTWIIVIIGLLGIVLVEHPSVHYNWRAGISALAAAICTSFSMIGLNRLKNVDARAIVVHFSGTATIVAIGYCSLTDSHLFTTKILSSAPLSVLICVGLIGTVSQLGMTRAFAKGDPARVSVVGLAQIVFAAIYDVVLWRRHFEAFTLLGMIIVIAPTGWLLLTTGNKKQIVSMSERRMIRNGDENNCN